MRGLYVNLEFPQGTDKSVHVFLKTAYFKWNVQKIVQNNGNEMYKKSVLHVLLFFTVLQCCLSCLALHEFLFEQTINII